MFYSIKKYLKNNPLILNLYNFLKKKVTKSNFIFFSLRERLECIERLENKKIYFFDMGLFKKFKNLKNEYIYFDLKSPPAKELFKEEVYILIKTEDLAVYSFLMNYLEEVFHQKISILFYGKMEFSGGTLLAPKNSNSIEWILFNHFLDYFKISSPVLTFLYEKKNNEIINFKKILLPAQEKLFLENSVPQI